MELFSSIWVQPETPTLRQEVPLATTDTPDDLQETPDDLQEAPNDPVPYTHLTLPTKKTR